MKDGKIILGFIGLIASGKGTAAKYFIKNHDVDSFRYSTILRGLLDRLYLPQSRDNMVNISVSLRETFGQDLLSRVISHDVDNSNKQIVIVEGIRRPEDIVGLRKLKGFQLVAIEVDAKIRYERLIKRNENPDDQTKTWEQFQKDHQRETEISISPLMKEADVRIDNSGSLEDLHKQLENLL